MIEQTTDRGLQQVMHEGYPARWSFGMHRLVSQASAVGDYPDALSRPGSSFLWVGEHHHLNREEVAKLRDYLDRWLTTGQLFEPNAEASNDKDGQ